MNLSVQRDEGVSWEEVLNECCGFIDTVDDEFLRFLSFGITLIAPIAIWMGSCEMIVFLIAEGEELESLLMGDLGGLEEDFLW